MASYADPPDEEIVWTIVVAGGSGSRFGGPKQFERLGEERVVDRSAAVARSAGHGVVIVLPSAEAAAAQHVATEHIAAEHVAVGGATRCESVRAGLAAVPPEATIICVHDAARPLATAALFRAVIEAVHGGADGAVPGMPVTDTVKQVGADGAVGATLDRDTLVAVQTPQAFRADVLRRAHAGGSEGSDDASLVEVLGGTVVVVVPGEADNRKLTHPDDLDWARRVLAVEGGERR